MFRVIFLLFISIRVAGQNPFREVDETRTFLGVTLFEKADYSQLKFSREGEEFNLYRFKEERVLKGPDYALTGHNLTVQRGLVTDILTEIPMEDIVRVQRDVAELFSRVPNAKSPAYFGKNVVFTFVRTGGKGFLYVALLEQKLPPLVDNSGLTELPGRKFADPLIQAFINQLGGKYTVTRLPGAMATDFSLEYAWNEQGIVMNFYESDLSASKSGVAGKDTSLSSIMLKLETDPKAKGKKKNKVYTGSLPYGIDPNDNRYRVIDKLGRPEKAAVEFSHILHYSRRLGIDVYFFDALGYNPLREGEKVSSILCYKKMVTAAAQ